jgi:hypothetical protein
MKSPHIAISYMKGIPETVIKEFTLTVSSPNLELYSEERKSDTYAGLEWYIPAALMVYLAKSYFDGFLKEMGKDHYVLLKKGLLLLGSKLLGKSAPEVTVIGSPGKVSATRLYSLNFSIIAEAEGRQKFKLLLQQNVSEQELDKILDAFLNFLEAYHRGDLSPEVLEKLSNARVAGGTLMLTFDSDSQVLEPVDPFPIQKPPA